MSSVNEEKACEICYQTELPNSFCIDCDTIFCPQCWSQTRVHASGKLNRDGIPHEPLPDKDVIDRLKHIFTPSNDLAEQRRLHRLDAGSKWFGIVQNLQGGLPILQDYGRYTSIMRDCSTGDTKHWPQLVSFVGQTGAGKSTLIKALVDYQERAKKLQNKDDFPSPVAGSANSHAPTSGDVHLYADPGTYQSRYPILYADCEGMDGGERIPISTQQTQETKPTQQTESEELPRRLKNRFHLIQMTGVGAKLTKQNKALKHEIKWADNQDKRKREFAVKNLYPKILYAFSDIVVFVLRNDRAFESGALVPLLQWADSSVESSVNQSVMPHVILVLNFADPTIDPAGWTVKSSTDSLLATYANTVYENAEVKEFARSWRERGKAIRTTKDLLHCYYSSVTVIRVPQKGRYGLVDGQIAELNIQIQQRCKEAREDRKRFRISFNAEEFQAALTIGFDHFSNRLDQPLDFVEISCNSNPIPEDFAGNILRLALAIKGDPAMANKTGRDIFEHLGHIVASCIMLDYVRHEIKGTPSRLLLHYKESYINSLKRFRDDFWPCSFVYRDHHCVNSQNGHAKGHQDASGWIFYSGAYESTDGLNEPNFIEEWHTMLESNLDHIRYRMYKMTKGETAIEEKSAAAELHLERINEFYAKLSGLSMHYVNHATFFCCLRELPEHPLPCGHVLCTPCVRSFALKKNPVTYAMQWCPLHKHQKWDEEWEIAVKPDLAGVRILTLDGGGIRGIVELRVLAEIQRNLGQLQIADFFDLIVGTSTGGIIALGLGVKNWPIDECIHRFEELCNTAFSPRLLPGVQQLTSLVSRKFHKYKSKKFDEILKENFGEDPLFGGKCEESRYQKKVAVVSTYGTGQEAVILTNYNRSYRNAEPDYKFERQAKSHLEMKIWEACRATSAAPSYFKPFRNPRTNRTYMDGALYYNNPARVAHQERQLLWPEAKTYAPDIMLSIGSSYAPDVSNDDPERDTRNTETRLYRVAINRFDNIMDAQNAWDKFKQEVQEPNETTNARYIRLNPEMERKAKLDEKKSLAELKNKVNDCLATTKWISETKMVARRLIASSFYFEKESGARDTTIEGWICCRFPDESNELRHLGRYLRNLSTIYFCPFFIISEEDDETPGDLSFITNDVTSAMIEKSTFKLKRLTIPPWSKQSRITIALCLTKDGESYPISGFPRVVGSQVLRDDQRKRKDKHAANERSDKATEGDTSTQVGEDDSITSNENSMNSPTVEYQNKGLSSSETLPLDSTEQEIPYWARGLQRSLPNASEESVGHAGIQRTDTGTFTNPSYDSPINSPLDRFSDTSESVPSTQPSSIHLLSRQQSEEHSTKTRLSPTTPQGDRNIGSSEHGQRMGDHHSRSDFRAHHSQLRGRTLTSPENVDFFVGHLAQHDTDDSIPDLDPTQKITNTTKSGAVEFGKRDEPTTSSTIFEAAAYAGREGGDMTRVTPGYRPIAHDIARDETYMPRSEPRDFQLSQGSQEVPSLPSINPCDITDMTEEEIFEIAKMRSLNFL